MRFTLLFAVAGLWLSACREAPPAPPARPKPGPAPVSAPQSAPPAAAASVAKADPAVAEKSAEPAPPAAAGKGAEAAAAAARHYYALIEGGKLTEAWALRTESDTASPAARDVFTAYFADYREYHATVGTPSDVQGAAGSLYVEVPVQTYGVRKDGKPFTSAGTITLRRSNDVPGSTAAQRRWRIYSN